MTGDRPAPRRDTPPDHGDDPRKARRGDGGYPEENPAAEGSERQPEPGSRSRGRDGDPGQATGNPRAAGADPGRRG